MPPPGRFEIIGRCSRYIPYITSKNKGQYGRQDAIGSLENWFETGSPCMVIHGIAGIGKSTLVANWLGNHMHDVPTSRCAGILANLGISMGLAVSLLHRFGVDDNTIHIS